MYIAESCRAGALLPFDKGVNDLVNIRVPLRRQRFVMSRRDKRRDVIGKKRQGPALFVDQTAKV